MDHFTEKHEAYARAIGLVILAMNMLEANVYFILDVMGEATQDDEGKLLTDKLTMLDRVAAKQTNPKIRARLENVVEQARSFLDDRNNFAHATLWVDGETGIFRRRYVRRKDKVSVEDIREPDEIEYVSFQISNASSAARDVAMDLGGNKRWEEYLASLGPDAPFMKITKPTK